MRTLSANFTTEKNKTSKQSIVRATFSGITRGYVSGPYSSISANDKKFLSAAQISLQNFDILTSPFSLSGDTSFEVADKDDDVTTVLNGDNLHGVDITTALGFQDIGSADFLSFPVTTIKKIVYNESNLSFRFISKDARRLLGQSLYYEPQTTLINDGTGITVSDTTITVDSNTGFIDPTNVPERLDVASSVRGWIKIGSELISYTALAFGNQFTGCVRGNFETNPATHEDNDIVIQIMGFPQIRPHDILLSVLMCTRDASGHAFYDLSNIDAAYGQIGDVGLTATEVDVEQIQQISYKTAYVTVGLMKIFLYRKINVITFIEDFILKPMGWYMFLHSNGKLKINSFDRIHVDDEFSSSATITNADIKSASLETREDLMINTIKTIDPLNTNNQRIPLVTQESETYKLDESVTAYGATQRPLEIDTTLFRGWNDTQGKQFLPAFFYFLGNIPATVKLFVRQKLIDLEPGDYVQITRASFPDLRAGTKGWTTFKGLITGQKIGLGRAIELDIFVWDLYTRVTNGISFNSVTVTDDTSVAFSATNSAVLETEDGFQDFSNISFDWSICTITIAKPNETPAGSFETISLGFHFQDPAGTDVDSGERRFIPYFTEDSDTITYKFIFVHWPGGNKGLTNIDRVKVDWYERSTATAGKQPTVTFTTFQHGNHDNTVSVL